MPRMDGPTASEVADYVVLAKTLTPSAAMEWKAVKGAAGAQRWRSIVEADGVMRGEVMLYVNLLVDRWWNFHLALRGHPIFGWHFKPGERHKNRSACGDDYVTNGTRISTPHEVHWLQGHGLKCAVRLEGLQSDPHEQVFREFSKRTNLDLGMLAYAYPTEGEQMMILADDAG